MLNSPSRAATGRRGAVSQGCMIGLVVGGGILLLALIVLGMGVSRYNALKTAKVNVDGRWANIDNEYKRRADLIPQLVETVKGSATFEKSTLQAVVDARASVGQVKLPAAPEDPAQLQKYIEAQQNLGGALSRLLVVAEQYPDLKASAGFRDLAVAVEGAENRIAVARTDYIDAVQGYNRLVTTFPGNVVAGFAGMKELPQMQAATPEERAVPKVHFDFGDQKK